MILYCWNSRLKELSSTKKSLDVDLTLNINCFLRFAFNADMSNLNIMKLPKRIDPCPIQEAVIEVRFESSLPPDAIFGVVYNGLKDTYSESQSLPILQIPQAVRDRDPNLTFQAHYRIKKDDYLLQVGPKMISLAISEKYPTWEEYLKEILAVFGKIKDLNVISKVSRLGLRYINIFEHDVLEKINLKITINENEIKNKETFFRTLFNEKGFQVVLQVGNHVMFKKADGRLVEGATVDLDVAKIGDDINFFENMESLLNDAHTIEKEQFFGLLKEDFIQTLNPNY